MIKAKKGRTSGSVVSIVVSSAFLQVSSCFFKVAKMQTSGHSCSATKAISVLGTPNLAVSGTEIVFAKS